MSKLGWTVLIVAIAIAVVVIVFLVIPPKEETAEELSSKEEATEQANQGTPDQPAQPDEIGLVEIEVQSLSYTPANIKSKADQEITLRLTNTTRELHTFTIDQLGIDLQLLPGETQSVTFTPTEPGTYPFYCTVGDHRKQGMEGSLIVE
jgi:plastocyanin